MGQKINPISLRLPSSNRNFDTSAYSDYYYNDVLMKDIGIRMYLSAICKQMHLSSGRIFLHYGVKTSNICVFFSDASLADTRQFSNFRQKKKKLYSRNKTTQKSTSFLHNVCALYFDKTKLSVLFSKVYAHQFAHHSSQTTIPSAFPFEKEMYTLYLTYTIVRYAFFMYYFLCANSQSLKLQHTLHEIQCFVLFKQTQVSNIMYKKNNALFSSAFAHLPTQSSACNSFFQALKANTLQTLFSQQSVSKNAKERAIHQFSRLFSNSKRLHFLPTMHLSRFQKQQQNDTQNIALSRKHSQMQIFCASHQTHSKTLVHSVQNKCLQNVFEKHRVYRTTSCVHHIQSLISAQLHTYTTFFAYKLQTIYASANVLAEEIVYLLEQNVSFRQIKLHILQERSQSYRFGEQLHSLHFLKGLRITCSGRVGGKSKKAQRAKTEVLRYGQTSLHVFSSNVDFACKHAKTSLGIVGVKVWLCFF